MWLGDWYFYFDQFWQLCRTSYNFKLRPSMSDKKCVALLNLGLPEAPINPQLQQLGLFWERCSHWDWSKQDKTGLKPMIFKTSANAPATKIDRKIGFRNKSGRIPVCWRVGFVTWPPRDIYRDAVMQWRRDTVPQWRINTVLQWHCRAVALWHLNALTL